MEQTKPEQALNVLDVVTSKFQGSRQDHILITEALAILKAVVEQWKATQTVQNTQ